MAIFINSFRYTCKLTNIDLRYKKNNKFGNKEDKSPLKLEERADLSFTIKNNYAFFEKNDRILFTDSFIRMTGIVREIN